MLISSSAQLSPVTPNSFLQATTATLDWQAEQMRIVDRPKPSIISSLSLLWHMKTDSQQIRSPTSPMAVKVVSTSTLNCMSVTCRNAGHLLQPGSIQL